MLYKFSPFDVIFRKVYRLTFDLGKIFIRKSILYFRKEHTKISKFAKFGCKML